MSSSTNKLIVVICISALLVFGLFLLIYSPKEGTINTDSTESPVVYEEEGKQVIEIKAKAGYFPTSTQAAPNKDTVLRVTTDNTFDCSSALTIPKLGIRKNLPPTAKTDIALGPQSPGSKITGSCTMGMYSFNLSFN